MPITASYDPDGAEIITAAQTVRAIDGFPKTIVVTFQPRTFAVLLEQYATTRLAGIHFEEPVESGSPVVAGVVRTFDCGGCVLGAYLSPVGAPGTVAVMEKAIALGAERFVVFGTCGALVSGLAAGGLIVPTAAYRDEGTSYHYAPPADYIAVDSAATTQAILAELGVPHVAGRVWTTDGFFRETRANVERRVRDGCLAVDMETAALAALAQFRGVAVHQFVYAADALSEEAWNPGTLGTLPAEPRARYAQIAVEVAIRLSADAQTRKTADAPRNCGE